MADIEKISREDFTNAIKVAEEKVDKELVKLKKSLEKKKITSREYVNKRMEALKVFVDMRRELQGMIDDSVESITTKKPKVVSVEEKTDIDDKNEG
jgi:rubrerythrin